MGVVEYLPHDNVLIKLDFSNAFNTVPVTSF